jgi:hypothetical protein
VLAVSCTHRIPAWPGGKRRLRADHIAAALPATRTSGNRPRGGRVATVSGQASVFAASDQAGQPGMQIVRAICSKRHTDCILALGFRLSLVGLALIKRCPP